MNNNVNKLVTTVAAAVASAFAVAYLIYNSVLYLREAGVLQTNIRTRRKSLKAQPDLQSLLSALDDENIGRHDLLHVLRCLANQCAFTKVQNSISELGYLEKIANILNYPDADIKKQTALLLNNLSLNEKNQNVLKYHIPKLIDILESRQKDGIDASLNIAVVQALTNLTTLDDSHSCIIPHIDAILLEIRTTNIKQVKIQSLKILVNLSSNRKVCENDLELDAKLLCAIEPYITVSEDEDIVLRAISCAANVLTSLHRRWQDNQTPNIATPEFVNERLLTNIEQLSECGIGDIQLQAGRCLMALNTPTTPRSSQNNSMDAMDILDVLKM